MTIHLDHLMVPSRSKVASARLLAELLDVPWTETAVGPFAAVYVSDSLTLDFDEWAEPVPKIHYCFRVTEDEFTRILERIKAMEFDVWTRRPKVSRTDQARLLAECVWRRWWKRAALRLWWRRWHDL